MKKFNIEFIQSELRNMPGWAYNNGYLEKNFIFLNFKDAMIAMVRIGFEAEKMDHHPDWSNSYNKLNIRLRTHSVDGITENDFSLARKIDELVSFMNKH